MDSSSMAADRSPRIKKNSILDDYEVKWREKLGTGISGPVRPCTKKSTGERFALKCLLEKPRALQEVNLHLKCSGHPNIVAIHDVYCNEVQFPGEQQARSRLLVVMEMMDGGELFDRISQQKYFTEKQAANYTRQIVSAINRCHSLNVAHRDIKPENLLLKDNSHDAVIKLSDFGFAKVDDGSLTTPHFTPYYVAPQVLEAQKHQSRSSYCIMPRNSPYTYDKSCDMWSMGVIIYIMLCGYPPFYSETPTKQITKNMKRKIMAGQYEFPKEDWQHISDPAVDLVKNLLEVDPELRLTVEDVMSHPWLNDAPETELQSPAVMLDRSAMEEMKAAHSQQLTTMRLPDHQLRLKPISDVNNPIMRRRHHQGQDGVWDNGGEMADLSSEDEPPVKHSSASMATQKLRDIIAHCIMPPKDDNIFTLSLHALVHRALSHNSDDKGVQEVLHQWGWDGEKFTRTVDRQKLAHSLSEIVQRQTQKLD